MANKIDEILDQAKGSIGATVVFAQPYEKNGVTVIPAARVMGGFGHGEGQTPANGGEGEQPSGSGAGYGMMGRPAGAFVVKGDTVNWLPAIDVNRLVFGFQIVMVVFLLAVRSVMNARTKAAR